jgi:prepilin-type N-terminal cleavage/methylation domain-containing protein
MQNNTQSNNKIQALHGRKRNGMTLIEVVVASAITLILTAVIYSFFVYSSKSVRRLTAMQLLQQESAVVAERFMREVRNGSFICAGDLTAAPSADTDYVLAIRIRNSSNNLSTGIVKNGAALQIVKYNASNTEISREDLTNHLWRPTTSDSTHFTVFQNGEHAVLRLYMRRPMGGDTLYLTQTIGDVRCKN